MTTQLPFRKYHLLKILEGYESSTFPLDRFLYHYFKENKALGSKDRLEISETIFLLMRWKRLLEQGLPLPITWEGRLFNVPHLDRLKKNETLPPAIRWSLPDEAFTLFAETFGQKEAIAILACQNEPAPTTIRVNTLKTTREALLALWKERFSVVACKHSLVGITFLKREPLFSLEAFQQGYFEVQDEGSQLLAELMAVKPKDLVLDFCAGSGGKTLAFAPKMEQKGQIFLHDIRLHALESAKKRLRRAGVQNGQIVPPKSKTLQSLKKKMDWVLVDAPCSGTGTWRRNPDMKWKFSKENLFKFVGMQRTIFEQALSYVKPGGKIVYATCSVMPQENEEQVAHFLNIYPLELAEKPWKTHIEPFGPDGFFAAVFKRR